MILLTTSDFTGYFNIPTSNARETLALLQTYIDRYEKMYLCQLLGVELAELFIADLANASQEARFTVIQDEFYFDSSTRTGVQYHSRGMVDFLSALVFYHFVTENAAQLTTNGVTVSVTENGSVLSPEGAYRFAERKWNEAQSTSEAIYWYIKYEAPRVYPTDPDMLYTEFNGHCLDFRFSPIF